MILSNVCNCNAWSFSCFKIWSCSELLSPLNSLLMKIVLKKVKQPLCMLTWTILYRPSFCLTPLIFNFETEKMLLDIRKRYLRNPEIQITKIIVTKGILLKILSYIWKEIVSWLKLAIISLDNVIILHKKQLNSCTHNIDSFRIHFDMIHSWGYSHGQPGNREGKIQKW